MHKVVAVLLPEKRSQGWCQCWGSAQCISFSWRQASFNLLSDIMSGWEAWQSTHLADIAKTALCPNVEW